jgi:succinyl-CoA synthetase beta subunit
VDLAIPLVVRLEGTNVEEGRRALAESGLDLIVGEGMADAADKVVAAVGRAS